MANEPTISFTGNVGGDPEIKFLPSGQSVVNVSVAVTPSRKDRDTQEWIDGDTMWFRVVAWGKDAEAITEHVHKGMRVHVAGVLAIKPFEAKEGGTRFSNEVTGKIYPVLKAVTVQQSSNGGDDPWTT